LYKIIGKKKTTQDIIKICNYYYYFENNSYGGRVGSRKKRGKKEWVNG
jgi:hypothetical protein